MEIYVRHDDGSEQDITEGVQAMYDLVISSMNWGSGMLSAEDARPVALLARACQFERWEEAERYLRDQEHSDQQREFIQKKQEEARELNRNSDPGWVYSVRWRDEWGRMLEHEHIFSRVGRCMWPGCEELGEMDPIELEEL